MLFLITNQSNCFTLFVLKLGGDTKCGLSCLNLYFLITFDLYEKHKDTFCNNNFSNVNKLQLLFFNR